MNGIFILAELGGAMAQRIRAVQERFDPKLAAEAPPHVTLIGSSGAGPIEPETIVEDLRRAIEPVTRRTAPITLQFRRPMRFLQREIVVLPLDPHGPMRSFHDELRASGLRYATARWPFTPHCTLSFYPQLTPQSLRQLLAVREDDPWTLDLIRVYHTHPPQPPTRLLDLPLSGGA